MGVKVTLRQKPISKGRKTLYLDFYPPIVNKETGKTTRREFIKYYLFLNKKEQQENINNLKERIKIRDSKNKDCESLKKELAECITFYNSFKGLSASQKKSNVNNLKIAQSIREKRQNKLNKPEIYTAYESEQLKQLEKLQLNFIDYFEKQLRKRAGSNVSNWISAFKHLKNYAGDEVKFQDLDTDFFEDFKTYLLSAKRLRSKTLIISRNSAASYFNKVKATLKQAFKDGILTFDLNGRIGSIKEEETHREFLTLEELQRLAETPFEIDVLRRAAFFSALTGLRFSDIQKLTWGEIVSDHNGGCSIKFRQQKTKGAERQPISQQAVELMGERGEPLAKVFTALKYSHYQNKKMAAWVKNASIDKHISFHCFRHTYATLQLANDTSITTLQKLMAHKSINTTMIYAKTLDKAKREAADKIKLKF